MRKWSLGELVPDLTKLQRTVSHYYWGSFVGFDATGAFRVKTVDRGILRFNALRAHSSSERGRRTRG